MYTEFARRIPDDGLPGCEVDQGSWAWPSWPAPARQALGRLGPACMRSGSSPQKAKETQASCMFAVKVNAGNQWLPDPSVDVVG